MPWWTPFVIGVAISTCSFVASHPDFEADVDGWDYVASTIIAVAVFYFAWGVTKLVDA